MKTTPLHLIRARGLLVAQPRPFSVRPRLGGSQGKHPSFLIRLLRPDVPLRLLPRLASPVRRKTALAVPRPAPAV
jgi:hypothetical protein